MTFRVECPDGVGPTRGAEPIGDGGLGTTTVRWALCASSAALIIAILTLASILIASGAAEAHPTLLFTDPAGDSAVAQSPPMLDLEFNEPVTIGARAGDILQQFIVEAVVLAALGGLLLASRKRRA